MNTEQSFRDILFGDLPMIKFILDASPMGRKKENGDIPVSEYGEILRRWINRYVPRLTQTERSRLEKELHILDKRMELVQEYAKRGE